MAPLVKLFQEQGWTVWWDSDITPGDSFDELIDAELVQARAIVVVWSKHSIASRWVRNEALEAADREILVPVRLDASRIPVAFRQTQVADLTRWPAKVEPAELEQLLQALEVKIGRESVRVEPVAAGFRWSRLPRLAYAVSLLIASVAIGAMVWQTVVPGSQAAAENGIAVLHLETNSSSEAAAFAADSLADEIMRVLEGVDGLLLANLTAGWELPFDLTPTEIADRLRVRYLVQGEVDEGSDGLSVQIQLFDAREGQTVFDREFTYLPSEVQELRQQIVQAVLTAVGFDDARIGRVLTDSATKRDSDAYDRYLRAKAILRRSGEMAELTTARDLLLQTTQQDPGFDAAHAALCRAELGIFRNGGEVQSFERAERACHRALTLGDGDAEAQLALGELYEASGQYGRAETSYRRALELDPLLTDAMRGLGYVLTMQGKARRAESAYRRAAEIQPGYWRTHNSLGWFYLQQGQYQEAIDAFTQVVFLAPRNPWGLSNRGSARFNSGDFAGALEDWEQSNAIDPDSGALSNMGTAYFYLGDFESSVRMYRMALDQSPTNYQLWLNLGDALRYLGGPNQEDGEKDGSVASASGAYQQAIRYIRAELTVNPKDGMAISAEARAQAFLGQRARAESLVDEALSVSEGNPQTLYNITLAYLSLEMVDQAAGSLGDALDAGLPLLIAQNDPLFDSLRASGSFDVGRLGH